MPAIQEITGINFGKKKYRLPENYSIKPTGFLKTAASQTAPPHSPP
jgi:hypothetical protein